MRAARRREQLAYTDQLMAHGVPPSPRLDGMLARSDVRYAAEIPTNVCGERAVGARRVSLSGLRGSAARWPCDRGEIPSNTGPPLSCPSLGWTEMCRECARRGGLAAPVLGSVRWQVLPPRTVVLISDCVVGSAKRSLHCWLAASVSVPAL